MMNGPVHSKRSKPGTRTSKTWTRALPLPNFLLQLVFLRSDLIHAGLCNLKLCHQVFICWARTQALHLLFQFSHPIPERATQTHSTDMHDKETWWHSSTGWQNLMSPTQMVSRGGAKGTPAAPKSQPSQENVNITAATHHYKAFMSHWYTLSTVWNK